MLEIFLIILGILYMDYSFGHIIGILLQEDVHTGKGRIQVSNHLARYAESRNLQVPRYGGCLVYRSPTQINIIILTFYDIYHLTLPRNIPSSAKRIRYIKNDQEVKCPYEIGPPLILPEGRFEFLVWSKGRFGGTWKVEQTTTTWN